MTATQIRNLIKKHSITGQEHPSIPCRFCGQSITPETPGVDLLLTKRKTLIVFHTKCYERELDALTAIHLKEVNNNDLLQR